MLNHWVTSSELFFPVDYGVNPEICPGNDFNLDSLFRYSKELHWRRTNSGMGVWIEVNLYLGYHIGEQLFPHSFFNVESPLVISMFVSVQNLQIPDFQLDDYLKRQVTFNFVKSYNFILAEGAFFCAKRLIIMLKARDAKSMITVLQNHWIIQLLKAKTTVTSFIDLVLIRPL